MAFIPTGATPLRGSQTAASRRLLCAARPARSPTRAPRMADTEAPQYETPVTRRLSDALKEKDVEARQLREEKERQAREKLEKKMVRQRKIDKLNSIPDDLEVGSVNQHMYEAGVQEELAKLDHDLVGLKPVKTRVAEIAALLIVDKLRKGLGLETAVPSLHMSFTGAPGTGKTTVAMRMGQLLKRMGYCRQGHLVVATRDDLVGQYVGHTAPKTKEVIKKAFGGVLLIDEAYYLYNASNDKDYGQESIEILLNVMEHQKDDLVVVLAGYEDRMDKFFGYNPGMSSRIGNHINFPNYKSQELLDIAKLMARDLEYEFADGVEDVFQKYIEKRMELPYFSNARTVRNAVDRARMRASIRLFNQAMSEEGTGMLSKTDLMTIMPTDLVSAEELAARGVTAIVE
ncbi:Protein cbbX-like [Gracilariopsis chorda]|uniref:Protein cbbX-like n=1 Tax=Gracilariopsis chorda TaxID=448386 RepID=A0A2V3ISM1_9FLOR|nr:Protein cbbX-like [Gracilariopsis chorda]|eukprot:PXF45125.1 Protein cbbX-like [Gracilariopsis chorda]